MNHNDNCTNTGGNKAGLSCPSFFWSQTHIKVVCRAVHIHVKKVLIDVKFFVTKCSSRILMLMDATQLYFEKKTANEY